MATGDGVLAVAVRKLSEFIIQEATFLLRVKDELVSIRDELSLMQAYLKDAEQKEDADERIRWWNGEIRSIAFKTKDVIDAYYEEVKGEEPSKTKLITTFFGFAGDNNVYDIGKEIIALKKRLSDISLKREIYGIINIDNTQEIANAAAKNRIPIRAVSFKNEEHGFVGFDDQVKLLGTQLFSSVMSRCAISIVGMAGSGKTTLARKLYQTPENSFELRAWVSVSRDWSHKDLLSRVISSLKEPSDDERNRFKEMDEVDMLRYLQNLFKDKRYLVVIDDLWDEDAWEECLRTALPDNNNGSRVTITTRNKSVAGLSDPRTYVHSLERLQFDESWKLFCNVAFSNQNGVCSPNLEDVGKKMVERCDGLPLAIIVLGALLSRKEPNEWQVVKKHIMKQLTNKSIHISKLLDLSYNDLSCELKSCFLYLVIFPEDHEIRSEKLIQLWIAEDLIPQSEGRVLEELAESYIKELDARSLIQLIRNTCRPNSTCRINNLLRFLAVNKAKVREELHIYGESMNTATIPFSARRIAFRSGFESYMANIDNRSYSQVRTLSFLNYHSVLDDGDATKLFTLIYKKFKSLRVLDLEGVKIETRRFEVNLRKPKRKLEALLCFGSHATASDELPETIRNMQDLQVVDVLSETNEIIEILPREVKRLKMLRYLSGSFGTKKGKPKSFEDLTNLHSLERIDISGWLTDEESHETALNAFSRLRNVRMLSLSFDTNHRLSIEPLCLCTNLIHLELNGSIKGLPMWLHESLPNLRYLYLLKAQFEQDPLPALERLTNLLVLSLDGFMLSMSLIITAVGFHELVSLSIHGIPEDMSLQIDEGALRSLGHIDIDPKLQNDNLPERLRNLI